MDHSGAGTSLSFIRADQASFGVVIEPSRGVPVVHEPDVLVIDAGPAGIGVAVAAARNGAEIFTQNEKNHRLSNRKQLHQKSAPKILTRFRS